MTSRRSPFTASAASSRSLSNRLDAGVEVLRRYLALPSSTWPDERCEAMRCLARMQPDDRMSWLDKARTEAPHRREVWLDLAEEFHTREDWVNLFWACANGIERSKSKGGKAMHVNTMAIIMIAGQFHSLLVAGVGLGVMVMVDSH